MKIELYTESWRYRLIASIICTVLGFMSSMTRAADQLSVIRVGSTAPGHMKFLLSQDQKFQDNEFAKDGIKIDYLPFIGGGSEAATALATEAIDIAYTGVSPALRLGAMKANVKVVAVSGIGISGTSSIFVRADSAIQTLADLKGKKVAYLTGTVRHSTLARALQSVGLSLKDIESLNLPFEASGPAIMRGDIDALVEGDISVSRLLEKHQLRSLFDGSVNTTWNAPSLISVNANFAKKHPDILIRFLKVDKQIAQWADANFDKTISIYAKFTGTPEEIAHKRYSTRHFNLDPLITDDVIRRLRTEEQFMRDANLLSRAIDYQTWVDTRYIDAAYSIESLK